MRSATTAGAAFISRKSRDVDHHADPFDRSAARPLPLTKPSLEAAFSWITFCVAAYLLWYDIYMPKKSDVKPTKKPSKQKKEPVPFGKGGKGSEIGKRLDQHWAAIESRFSKRPKKFRPQKWDPDLVATHLEEYLELLPFPLIPFIEDFCDRYGIPRSTYYSILEQASAESSVSYTHSRLLAKQKARWLRVGEHDLMHAGIHKNIGNCLSILDSDIKAIGEGVASGLAFYDELKSLSDERRKEARAKKTGSGG